MEIRELKAKDTKALVKMLGKLSPKARNDLSALIKGSEGKHSRVNMLELGIGIFQMLAELTDDIYAWLADMAGITVEELDNMSASTPIDIVKEIVGRGDFQSFFGSLSQQNIGKS